MDGWLKKIADRLTGRPQGDKPEPTSDRRADLMARRAAVKKTINDLDLQMARFGSLHAPAQLMADLRQAWELLAQLDAEIAQDGPALDQQTERGNRLAQLQSQRAAIRRGMQDLELQEAKLGKHNTPDHVTAQLLEKRQLVAELDVEIARLGG
jgi:hypothetical protein